LYPFRGGASAAARSSCFVERVLASSDQARGPERRGAGSERGRFSLVPPMPVLARPEGEVLDECDGLLGGFFWQALRDVLLWAAAGPEARRGLFVRPLAEIIGVPTEVPDVEAAIGELLALSAAPERAEPARVAEACAELALWAEGREKKRTAAHFAEAAARVEPHVSARSFTAGRLNRRLGDAVRAAMWYSRAARLARLAYARGEKRSEVDFANAHLGYGNLQHDLGKYTPAEYHYLKAVRAALRSGRKSLAASAHHNLIGVAFDTGRVEKALEHAQAAVRLLPSRHPEFPALVHDIALLLLRQSYFSSAIPILEKVLPRLERRNNRLIALASLARCAAAVKDHIRFERAASAVLAIVAEDNESSDTALYHLAEGARSFWEWERAHDLATQAIQIARDRGNAAIIPLAERLLVAVAMHERGDVDQVPLEGGAIDALWQAVLRKLKKQPAPDARPEAVPPEHYPID